MEDINEDFINYKAELKNSIINNNDESSYPELLLNDKHYIREFIKNKENILSNNENINTSIIIESNDYARRLCLLFKYLNQADEKIEELNNLNRRSIYNENCSYTSKLKAVSDIVKSNKNLIYTHYLIEWIFEVNKIKFRDFNNCKEKLSFANEIVQSQLTKETFFTDVLHRKDKFEENKNIKPSFFKNESGKSTNYIKIVEDIKILLLQGRLVDAQNKAEELGLVSKII
jgi:uncharacterized protein YfcZ (UPF0381/DUF406 family)